jgi:bifunctional non-homologous end joining protein LigD
MLKPVFEPCIPTPGTKVPAGADWIHEIKHDGYRLVIQREGKRVRLFTRNGNDWSNRFPLITEAALRNRISSFVIDGEAVLLGVDGRSDFAGLHSRKHNDEVQFYAFDILGMQGEDLRQLPLHLRKNNLARLLARRVAGIFLSDFEQGEIGPDLFRHACKMGLEGLVRSGSAMAGPKARKTSSGSKRSKNCETRINRAPSARPARERNVLKSNAERRRSFCLSQSPSSGDVRAEALEQAALTQGCTGIAALASRRHYNKS